MLLIISLQLIAFHSHPKTHNDRHVLLKAKTDDTFRHHPFFVFRAQGIIGGLFFQVPFTDKIFLSIFLYKYIRILQLPFNPLTNANATNPSFVITILFYSAKIVQPPLNMLAKKKSTKHNKACHHTTKQCNGNLNFFCFLVKLFL